jgi:hypothetical protein
MFAFYSKYGVKLRMIRWAGHVAQVRQKRNAYRTIGGKIKERNNLKDLDEECLD